MLRIECDVIVGWCLPLGLRYGGAAAASPECVGEGCQCGPCLPTGGPTLWAAGPGEERRWQEQEVCPGLQDVGRCGHSGDDQTWCWSCGRDNTNSQTTLNCNKRQWTFDMFLTLQSCFCLVSRVDWLHSRGRIKQIWEWARWVDHFRITHYCASRQTLTQITQKTEHSWASE